MCKYLIKIKRPIAVLAALIFLYQDIGFTSVGQASFSAKSEVQQKAPFLIDISPELARVEEVHSGVGPAIIHIKTTHGHSGVQKQIESILLNLKNKYGIHTVLVEGSAS